MKRHEETTVHQEASQSAAGSSSLTAYFGASRGPTKHRQDVVDAEVEFGYFISEHVFSSLDAEELS